MSSSAPTGSQPTETSQWLRLEGPTVLTPALVAGDVSPGMVAFLGGFGRTGTGVLALAFVCLGSLVMCGTGKTFSNAGIAFRGCWWISTPAPSARGAGG